MKKLIGGVACTLAAIIAPGTAQATCAEFQLSGSERNLTYDPFAATPVERVFTLRARRIDPRVNAVRVLIVDPGVAFGKRAGRGDAPDYDIRWNKDMSRDVLVSGAEQPNATNGALIAFGNGRTGDVVHESFRIRIPPGQDIDAGTHYRPLDIRFTCVVAGEAAGAAHVQTGAQVALDLRVPDRISTYIGARGTRRGTIAFGALEPGDAPTRGLVITALSTIPYDIRVDTEHGALKRSGRDDATLRYAMRLSGITVRDNSRISCNRTPAPSGRGHPLQVTLEPADIARAPAGDYRETVTLTFSPRHGLSGAQGCAAASG